MTIITGNISKAAETRTVNVGGVSTLVTDFNVAENYQARNGERQTQFYRVSIWREPGAKLAKYLTKGRPICLEGRVKGRAYLDKNGQPQCQLEMANPRVKFLTANATVDEATEIEEDLPFTEEE